MAWMEGEEELKEEVLLKCVEEEVMASGAQERI